MLILLHVRAGTLAEEVSLGASHIHWRQIESLLNDPFVQKGSDNRMSKLLDIGIGIVGTVPFSFQEERGIVLYYSRSSANTALLRESSNEAYLMSCANVIGAVYANQKARRERARSRRISVQKSITKVRKVLLQKQSIGFGDILMNKDLMMQLREQRNKERADEGFILLENDALHVHIAKNTLVLGKRMVKR